MVLSRSNLIETMSLSPPLENLNNKSSNLECTIRLISQELWELQRWINRAIPAPCSRIPTTQPEGALLLILINQNSNRASRSLISPRGWGTKSLDSFCCKESRAFPRSILLPKSSVSSFDSYTYYHPLVANLYKELTKSVKNNRTKLSMNDEASHTREDVPASEIDC